MCKLNIKKDNYHLSFRFRLLSLAILSHFYLTSLLDSFSTCYFPMSGTSASKQEFSLLMTVSREGVGLQPYPVMPSGSQYEPQSRSQTEVILPQLQLTPQGKWWMLWDPAQRIPLKGIMLTLSWMLMAHKLVTTPWRSTRSMGNGTKKQLVNTGTACRNASMGWNANPEQGVTLFDLWWMQCSLSQMEGWCRSLCTQQVRNSSQAMCSTKYRGNMQVRFQLY